MKQIYTLIIALVALTSANQTNAQTYSLDLGSSFSPAWTAGGNSGTASNIGGSGINCTVNIGLTGGGSIVSPYPRVNKNNSNSSDFVVQGSTDAMEVDIDLANRTSYVSITYTFSAPVQNASFAIADIDMPGGSSTYTYVDQVTVTGNGPAGTILPSLSKYKTSSDIFDIDDNVATATTGKNGGNVSSLQLNNSAQDGTMFVNFNGNAVTSITIRYGTLNSSLVSSKPGLQAIAFGNISFEKAIAPLTSNISMLSMKNSNAATAITALSGTDDESIASFKIVTLPAAASGVLTYKNGSSYTAVTAGQVLTPAQAASLKFDPAPTFSGNAVFTYSATDNRGVVSNVSNYSISVTFSLLPVTLTDFSGVWNNNSIVISWTTQQEINADKFLVEKSNDGSNWQTMATVHAVGNSSIALSYRATDAQPFATNYYRLKQVDKDGAYVYSSVIKVNGQEKNNFSIKVFPNPVTSTATITTSSTENKTVHIRVFSNNGAQVKEITRQLSTGTNLIDIPAVNTLSNGLYTVTIEDGKSSQPAVARFIKQ